jgi:hypothetical protein
MKVSPSASSSARTLIMCWRDRPKRSTFQTSTASNFRWLASAISWLSAGCEALDPVSLSTYSPTMIRLLLDLVDLLRRSSLEVVGVELDLLRLDRHGEVRSSLVIEKKVSGKITSLLWWHNGGSGARGFASTLRLGSEFASSAGGDRRKQVPSWRRMRSESIESQATS